MTQKEIIQYHKEWRNKMKQENPIKYQEWLAKQRRYGAKSRANRTIEQKERIKQKRFEWRQKNLERIKQVEKQWRDSVKKKVFDHYGKTCTCCEESLFEFLVIDHIEGGGNQHRKTLGRMGTAFYKWLENQGFPEEYRILCHNCNQSLGIYGYCPHFNLSSSLKGVRQSG